MLATLVHLVIYLVIVGCILGLLLLLVNRAPIPEPYKGWLHFAVLAIAIIMLIFFLLGLVGNMPIYPGKRLV